MLFVGGFERLTKNWKNLFDLGGRRIYSSIVKFHRHRDCQPSGGNVPTRWVSYVASLALATRSGEGGDATLSGGWPMGQAAGKIVPPLSRWQRVGLRDCNGGGFSLPLLRAVPTVGRRGQRGIVDSFCRELVGSVNRQDSRSRNRWVTNGAVAR